MQRIVLKLREKDFDSFFKAGLEEADLTNNGLHKTGAPNENVVQNHLNIALLNVF